MSVNFRILDLETLMWILSDETCKVSVLSSTAPGHVSTVTCRGQSHGVCP